MGRWWQRDWIPDTVGGRLRAGLVGVACVGVLAVALVWAARVGVPSGSIAEWVAGWGTLAAVSVALVEAAHTRRRQLGHDEREADRERRAQAEQVAAWCVDEQAYATPNAERHAVPDEALFDPEAWHQDVTVALRNNSDRPIFDAVVRHVWWSAVDAGRAGIGKHVIGPRAVGPGDTLTETFFRAPEGEREAWPAIDLQFTDAAGVSWRRDPLGVLTEIKRNQHRRSSGSWPLEDNRAEYRAHHGLPPLDAANASSDRSHVPSQPPGNAPAQHDNHEGTGSDSTVD